MPDDVRRVLASLLAEQGGLVTRAQLGALGVPPSRLGTVDRPGELIRLRRGAYTSRDTWAGADESARTALRVAAARLCTDVDLVAVRGTAAVVHGLPLLGRPGALQLAERKPERPQHHGVSRTVHPDDVVQVHGVPVTTTARTAVDVARGGFAAGVVTADAVLRRGVGRAELERVLARSPRWPGRRTAVDVVAFADPLAETALESLGRARLHQCGLPVPQSQVWIADAHGPFARVDHCWRDRWTVAEADGALKYTDRAALSRRSGARTACGKRVSRSSAAPGTRSCGRRRWWPPASAGRSGAPRPAVAPPDSAHPSPPSRRSTSTSPAFRRPGGPPGPSGRRGSAVSAAGRGRRGARSLR